MQLNLQELPAEIVQAKQRYGIVGNAPGLIAAVSRAIQVAPIDLSVLVTGESGTGKEFFLKSYMGFHRANIPSILLSTVARFRKVLSIRNFSDMRKVRSPGPYLRVKVILRRLTVARFFSMRLPSFR